MKSLLIVGSPRSMTTWTAVFCQQATGMINLQEAFNLHHAYAAPVPIDHCDRSREGYRWICDFLSDHQRGHVIKDVVQPIHLSRFLDQYPGVLNAVYVHRQRDEVLACQRRLKFWAADPLVYEELYRGVPRLEYAKLVNDPGHLHQVLIDLGYRDAKRVEYLNPEFTAYSQKVAERLQEQLGPNRHHPAAPPAEAS